MTLPKFTFLNIAVMCTLSTMVTNYFFGSENDPIYADLTTKQQITINIILTTLLAHSLGAYKSENEPNIDNEMDAMAQFERPVSAG